LRRRRQQEEETRARNHRIHQQEEEERRRRSRHTSFGPKITPTGPVFSLGGGFGIRPKTRGRSSRLGGGRKKGGGLSLHLGGGFWT